MRNITPGAAKRNVDGAGLEEALQRAKADATAADRRAAAMEVEIDGG